jgi:hypothetical protein
MSHKRNWSLSAEAGHILLDTEKPNESDLNDNEYPEKEDNILSSRRRSGFHVHSVPKSIPKSSAFKVLLQSPSVSHSFPKPDFNMGISPSDHQVLSNHLMEEPSQYFGSVSHSLLGGATTRDIYQWKEKNKGFSRKRTNSEPNLVLIDENEEQVVYASELRQPGVFRRFFMASKAARYFSLFLF